ncbi:MAG: HAMP domain-containing histidine kinase, partial [Oscillospiraceae bacterium]|nr:HAMP domain-containing histidine kinase [Oscillospiraceae bacterium]
FINIIDNAIKYSDSGGTVTVTVAHDSQMLTVKVADTGIGIEPGDLERVKLKFYKADSTRRGSGIGLAVADEIITRHGGTLEVQSIISKGTTVTISLPVCSLDEGTQIDGAGEE